MANVFDFVNALTIVESLRLHHDDIIVTAKLLKTNCEWIAQFHVDWLVQECIISIPNALEIL